MKAGIIYYSKTGHSKKIAEAISTALQIQAEDIKSEPKLSNLDLLFIIGGIYAGKSDPALIAYINKIESTKVKKVALITTCASNKTKQVLARETLVKNNIEVLPEEFICKGNFLLMAHGHPNQTDIKDAVSYARKIAK
jgi:flavodoxin